MPKDKEVLTGLLIIGDSLTDRGEMERRKLLGIIPMDWISGLRNKSPDGRFTNGYNWADVLAVALIQGHEIDVIEGRLDKARQIAKSHGWRLTKEQLSKDWQRYQARFKHHIPSADEMSLTHVAQSYSRFANLSQGEDEACRRCDIGDAVLTHDKRAKSLDRVVHLNDEDTVFYKKTHFIRSYAEGGMTAKEFRTFKNIWTRNPKHIASRLILMSLKRMRERLLKDDKRHPHLSRNKATTLVVEWSGANDLVTVSSRPTPSIARKAVKARIENVEALISHGYQHFVLFNLPDMALTPRFQTKQKKEVNYAHLSTRVFNQTLAAKVDELKIKYPKCQFHIFDTADELQDIYHHPEQYGFDRDKRTETFLDHTDEAIDAEGHSPSEGYMFWDKEHPTMDLQALLALKLLSMLNEYYEVDLSDKVIPQQQAMIQRGLMPQALVQDEAQQMQDSDKLEQFKDAYARALDKDYAAFGGSWTRSKAPDLSQPETNFKAVHQHGLFADNRTRKVLQQLGLYQEPEPNVQSKP